MPPKSKPRVRRKFRQYLRGNIDNTMALGTLGSKVVISSVVAGAVVEETWLSSIVASWSISDFSNNAGDGPILVGVAHSDYSTAEIEAFLENTSSWDAGNLVQQEIAKRKIRIIGTFDKGELGSVDTSVLNDGKPIRTKCGWMLVTGAKLRVWAYNMGSSALDTTDPDVFTKGHANLWPR